MKKMMIAVALTIALPGAAFAQAKPAADNMGGMNMQGMNMSGMNMPNMSCKDMKTMMAKDHSMHMSAADMQKMCPAPSKAAPKAGGGDAHQDHSNR